MADELLKHAPTIRDVAERVGVHKATVSAVLNGGRSTARVSEATRAQILQAAKELEYVPNAMARGLKMVRFRSLGLVFNYQNPAWITVDEYGIALMTGIIIAASQAGYNVTHFHKTWQGGEHSATAFRGQGIDGFLAIAPPIGSDIVASFSALGIPVVVVSAAPDTEDVPYVVLDNAKAIRLLVEHLAGLGHQRIGYMYGGAKEFDSEERRKAFVRIMHERGSPPPPELMADLDNIPGEYRRWGSADRMFVDDSAYEQARRMFQLPKRPTAIITAGASAEAVIYAARATGITVPRDLSIVSIDDTKGVQFITPPVTATRQPLQAMGECASRLLIARVERSPIPQIANVFEPQLILRHSTAAAR